MTPAARVQAAIDILDRVIESARRNGPAADTIIGDWIRGHRFAGSKDKRAIREHVYAAIRAFGEVPASGRAAMVTLLGDDPALFDGTPYGPVALKPGEPKAERSILPSWLGSLIPDDTNRMMAALEAYSLVRPPPDPELVRVLDTSGVVVGVINWLSWLYVERRAFGDRLAVANRLTTLADRLAKQVAI